MTIKRRVLLRSVDISKASPQRQKEAQERYFIKLIRNNPHYRLIMSSLVEGVQMTEIARHFAMNQWTNGVSERTFNEALRAFRKACAEEISAYEPDSVELEKKAPANSPRLDTIGTLHQLMRIQKIRLGIDFKVEQSIGKLFNTTAKEIETTAKIAEMLLKAEGKITDGKRSEEPMAADVQEDLSRIKKEEITQNRLHSIVKQLAESKT